MAACISTFSFAAELRIMEETLNAGAMEVDHSEWLRECASCYSRGRQEDFITCECCQAMLYCSVECQQRDWGTGETTSSYSHSLWCARMKGFMDREKELRDFSFSFAEETTDKYFHEQKVVEFLKRHGVYGQGLWRRESPLLHKTGQHKKCGYYTLKDTDTWVIPKVNAALGSCPATPPPSATSPLRNWEEYYAFRGLSLDCPVAMVLTYPLTLYYVLTFCMKSDAPEAFSQLLSGEEFVIHLLGVEKEVEMISAFLECARLLPSRQLHIVMYGKGISSKVDNHQWQRENLRVSVRKCWYHDKRDPPPHVAVGFNAGIPAYPTWSDTLKKLMEQGTPSYFTDQSEFSCVCASDCVKSLGWVELSKLTVNPFRSPMRIVTREQNMPWFSNAFLLRLCYGDRLEDLGLTVLAIS